MRKKMYLFSGILTFIVFVVMLIDIITTNYGDFSQIKSKEIIYLIGWLLLSASIFYEYNSKRKL